MRQYLCLRGLVYLRGLRDSRSQRELKIEAPSGPDVTHQEIVTLSASQRSMLRLLAAWGEDVGALTSRGLHVGQTEGAQVLHTLFHLQLITLPR